MKEAIEASLERLDVILQIFAVIVAVGVLGEAVFGVRHVLLSKRLRALQNSENAKQQLVIASLQTEAEVARKEAEGFRLDIAEANTRATSAEAQVASANAASRDAVAKVANAEARIAEAQRGSAEANLLAERERTARLQLEAKLADRRISAAQQLAMVENLKAWSGITVDVVVWGDTPEIKFISTQILEAMQQANWIIQLGNAAGSARAVRGILVGTRPDAGASAIAASAALVSALHSAGLESKPWNFAEMQPPFMVNSSYKGTAPLRMFIGSKP
jgi:hypothetical protein